MIAMDLDLPCTTTLTISSKSPLCTRTDRLNLLNSELRSDQTIKPSDPNYEKERTKSMQELLQDVELYEEAIMLNKVISVIDRGLVKMRNSGRRLNMEISELKKLRQELQMHLDRRQMLCEPTRKICEQLTSETQNQSLRIEIQMHRNVLMAGRR